MIHLVCGNVLAVIQFLDHGFSPAVSVMRSRLEQ